MTYLRFNLLIIILLTTIIFHGAAANEEYVLGPGDIIRISVYGHEDLNSVARVNENGKITFPLVGEIGIGKHTVSDAEDVISRALKKGGFVRSPQLSIIVEQYRNRQVSVLGEVKKPGAYSIEGTSTIVDLIAMAGGVSESASESIRLVTNKRGKPLQVNIDLYEILFNGDMEQNIDVSNGDIIFVPKMDRFYIYGEVQRPGVFRLERNMIVMQALAVGGGITARGTERGLVIKRINEDGEVLEIDALANDLVSPNDVIYVKESLF